MLPVMHDTAAVVFGSPAGLLTVGAGLVGMLVGVHWIRRIVAGDAEPESFWATAGRHRGLNLALAAGLLLAAVAGVLGVLVRS
jgi:hypothetical protein